MPSWFWTSLAVGLAASLAGTALAATRGWRLFRRYQAASRTLRPQLDELSRRTAEGQRLSAQAQERRADLHAELERLRVSLAILRALATAASDVLGGLARFGIVPSRRLLSIARALSSPAR